MAVWVQCNAAEMTPVDVRDPVMLRESLVEKGIIRVEQVEHTAVFPEHGFEMQFRFVAKGLAQVVVELGKKAKVRSSNSAWGGAGGVLIGSASW
jgi:hypothetical protein